MKIIVLFVIMLAIIIIDVSVNLKRKSPHVMVYLQ